MPRRHLIRWAGSALADLREIRDYVNRDNPVAARRLARRIRERISKLPDHPHTGRLVPEFAAKGYREVIVAPYRIVYYVQQREVIVLRVWHGRRDLHALAHMAQPETE